MIALLPVAPSRHVRVMGFELEIRNAPPSDLVRRALARTTPGDVAAFHAKMRARTEAARALRGRP